LSGTEAVQTISANVVLVTPLGIASYTGTWTIDGSNSLNVSGNIGQAGWKPRHYQSRRRQR